MRPSRYFRLTVSLSVLVLLSTSAWGQSEQVRESCSEPIVLRPFSWLAEEWAAADEYRLSVQERVLPDLIRYLERALANTGSTHISQQALDTALLAWKEAADANLPATTPDNVMVVYTDIGEARLLLGKITPLLLTTALEEGEADLRRLIRSSIAEWESIERAIRRAELVLKLDEIAGSDAGSSLSRKLADHVAQLGGTIKSLGDELSLLKELADELDARSQRLSSLVAEMVESLVAFASELQGPGGVLNAEDLRALRARKAALEQQYEADLEAAIEELQTFWEETWRGGTATAAERFRLAAGGLIDLLGGVSSDIPLADLIAEVGSLEMLLPKRLPVGSGLYLYFVPGSVQPEAQQPSSQFRLEFEKASPDGSECPLYVNSGVTLALTNAASQPRGPEIAMEQVPTRLEVTGIDAPTFLHSLRVMGLTEFVDLRAPDADDIQVEVSLELPDVSTFSLWDWQDVSVVNFSLSYRTEIRLPEIPSLSQDADPAALELQCTSDACLVFFDGRRHASLSDWQGWLEQRIAQDLSDVSELFGFEASVMPSPTTAGHEIGVAGTLALPRIAERFGVEEGATARADSAGEHSIPVSGKFYFQDGHAGVFWDIGSIPDGYVAELARAASRLLSIELGLQEDRGLGAYLQGVTLDRESAMLVGELVLPTSGVMGDCGPDLRFRLEVPAKGSPRVNGLSPSFDDCVEALEATVNAFANDFVGRTFGRCIAPSGLTNDWWEASATQSGDDGCEVAMFTKAPFAGVHARLVGEGTFPRLQLAGEDREEPDWSRVGPELKLTVCEGEACTVNGGDWVEPSHFLEQKLRDLGFKSELIKVETTAGATGVSLIAFLRLHGYGYFRVAEVTVTSKGVRLVGGDLATAIEGALKAAIENELRKLFQDSRSFDLADFGPIRGTKVHVDFSTGTFELRLTGELVLYDSVITVGFEYDALTGDFTVDVSSLTGLSEAIPFCTGGTCVDNVQPLSEPYGVKFDLKIDVGAGIVIPLKGITVTTAGTSLSSSVPIPIGEIILSPLTLSNAVVTIDLDRPAVELTGDLTLMTGTAGVARIDSLLGIDFEELGIQLKGTLIVFSVPMARAEGELRFDPRFHVALDVSTLPPISRVIDAKGKLVMNDDLLSISTHLDLLGLASSDGYIIIDGSGLTGRLRSDVMGVGVDFEVSFTERLALERAAGSASFDVFGYSLASAGLEVYPYRASVSAHVFGMGLVVSTPHTDQLTKERVYQAILELFSIDKAIQAILESIVTLNFRVQPMTSWGTDGDGYVGDGNQSSPAQGPEGYGESPYPEQVQCRDQCFPSTGNDELEGSGGQQPDASGIPAEQTSTCEDESSGCDPASDPPIRPLWPGGETLFGFDSENYFYRQTPGHTKYVVEQAIPEETIERIAQEYFYLYDFIAERSAYVAFTRDGDQISLLKLDEDDPILWPTPVKVEKTDSESYVPVHAKSALRIIADHIDSHGLDHESLESGAIRVVPIVAVDNGRSSGYFVTFRLLNASPGSMAGRGELGQSSYTAVTWEDGRVVRPYDALGRMLSDMDEKQLPTLLNGLMSAHTASLVDVAGGSAAFVLTGTEDARGEIDNGWYLWTVESGLEEVGVLVWPDFGASTLEKSWAATDAALSPVLNQLTHLLTERSEREWFGLMNDGPDWRLISIVATPAEAYVDSLHWWEWPGAGIPEGNQGHWEGQEFIDRLEKEFGENRTCDLTFQPGAIDRLIGEPELLLEWLLQSRSDFESSSAISAIPVGDLPASCSYPWDLLVASPVKE